MKSSASQTGLIEIRVEGRTLHVPSVCIDGKTAVVRGKWLKRATLMDEELDEGETLPDPGAFIEKIKGAGLKADIFCFTQKLWEQEPKFEFHTEEDNAAAIPLTNYAAWWDGLSQETRRNVRKAAKMGLTTAVVPFSDGLLEGIHQIYNETPVRQGRKFWHYGKPLEVIKKEASTYPERSDFIGCFLGDVLVGFIKLIYADKCAHIIHILSRVEHADKKPTNALIAKAVEVASERQMAYLTYCKYVYGKNETSPLTEFKRRNGFQKLLYPRYFIPLSLKGRIVLALKLHHGIKDVIKDLIPQRILTFLLEIRARFSQLVSRKSVIAAAESTS